MRFFSQISFKESFNDFVTKSAVLLFLTFLLWGIDWVLVSANHSVEGLAIWKLVGLLNDLSFTCLILAIYFPVHFIFSKINIKLTDGVSAIFFSSVFIFGLCLSFYFKDALIPLRIENLKGMSSQQVTDIIQIYGFSFWHLLFLIPIVLIVFILVRKASGMNSKKLHFIVWPLATICLVWTIFLNDYSSKSDIAQDLQVNKTSYFISSWLNYKSQNADFKQDEVEAALKEFYALNDISKTTYRHYPFFDEKRSENHLGQYFIERDSAPNIVFIIVESLGRQFSGPDAKLGSFTPFIDSLANEGLYWGNCLSNAERTFGALPNLMAGVPEGDRGFLNLRSSMPDHLSLPLLLSEHNDYQTNFFCGALKTFDYMNEYLMFQKFKGIYGESDFEKNNELRDLEYEDGHSEKFNWGAEDRKVFEESMHKFNESPFFNLYLTTSFHEPFAFENLTYYIDLASKKIDALNPENKSDYLSELETFGALMYTDASVKRCIELYAERDDFENTIFVIVGDHSIKFMSDDSRLEKYNVPLLIYSPLLKSSAEFKNVVCHKDVPAALQSLLRDNFQLKLPEFSISQSNNLKTKVKFESEGNYALMYADKRLENILYKDLFIADEQLFKLVEKEHLMLLEGYEGPEKEELKRRLSNYKYLSNYVCSENRYLPEIIYTNWVGNRFFYRIADDFDQPYNSTSGYDVYHHGINQGISYSDSSAITNLNSPYLSLFEKIPLKQDANHRLRIKMKFKIFSESGSLPAVYLTHFYEDATSNYDLIHMNSEYGLLRPFKKQGWQEFQFSFWMNIEKLRSVKEQLSIHLHQPDKSQFYLDDLLLEIQEF